MNAIIERLLGSSEPSIRWKTRVYVLGENPDSGAIQELQEEIRNSPRVKALLSARDSAGRLVHAKHIYDKWQGAHWIMTTLADIGFPASDRSLHPVRDQLLDCWLDDYYYREFEADDKAASYQMLGAGKASRQVS